MIDPLIDDTAICPACDGSGFGVADVQCGYCGGCGGVPMSFGFNDPLRLDQLDDDDLEAWLGG